METELQASPDRVAAACRRCTAKLERLFAAAGLVYPARTVLLRGFKHERELEVWAQPSPERAGFKRVATYPILGASGVLGPKLCEGDRQVPEGFYRVTRFNPRSRFHLSLGLDYPNAADLRRTTNPAAPGSDIFIHGNAESKGCLAMGDDAMEEIYLLARGAEETLVHLFPCRMTAENWSSILLPLLASAPGLEPFWRQLRSADRFFDEHHQLSGRFAGPRETPATS